MIQTDPEFDTFTPCPDCQHPLAAHVDENGRARACAVYEPDERSNAPRHRFCGCRRMLNMEGKP